MADLPGLIEGAHQGKGLGLQFLRHIERCRVIVHVIDLSETGRDPYEDYQIINNELKEYGFALDKRPQIIVASKMDEEGANEKLKKLEKQIGKEIIPISAITEENIDKLLYKCAEVLKETPLFPLYDAKEEDLDHKTYTLEDEEPFFTIRRIDAHTWSIEGEKMLKFYHMTNISTDEGMMVLMSKIRALRIDDELENRGAEDGDTVILDDFEFEYVR
jgi:GTP-binding protein